MLAHRTFLWNKNIFGRNFKFLFCLWKKTFISDDFGQGPKKKLTFKDRMVRNLEKQIKKAKKMGFINGKKICVGIGQCLYYCKVVKILINGKILVTYKNNDYIYSFRNLKIMVNNGKYIIERDHKRRRMFIYLGSYWTSDDNYLLNRYKINNNIK